MGLEGDSLQARGGGDEANRRFERKFVVAAVNLHDLLIRLRLHSAMFRQIYADRWVNNVYFDTFARDAFHCSVDGIAARHKLRIRWYGALAEHPVDPAFELKVKRGLLGWKFRYPLEGFALNRAGLRRAAACVRIEHPHGQLHLALLKQSTPVLINRYKRSYLVSFDRRFRITLDAHHSVRDVDSLYTGWHTLGALAGPGPIIMELKYAEQDDEAVDRITRELPYRLAKSSKYVDGLSQLYA